MLLSRSKQLNTIRFGGLNRSKEISRDGNFDPGGYLNSLTQKDFTSLFREWLAQCWIYDNTEKVPLDLEDLSKFDVNSLIPEFRDKYISGDWKLVAECSGASIDEMTLVWQMFFKQPILTLLNEDQIPPPTLPEVANYFFIPKKVLLPIFLEFINQPIGESSMVLITDGISHHVFNTTYFDQSRKVLRYEDNVGANNRCFLNRENNALEIESAFIGYNKVTGIRGWEVSLEDFEKVFYGVPLIYYVRDHWNNIAMEIAEKKYVDDINTLNS